ncbi:MAG: hypothetical protein JWP61_2498 [Friedmanniella sp.]|nr:hypothetical protein [Friedmanniella sp.]
MTGTDGGRARSNTVVPERGEHSGGRASRRRGLLVGLTALLVTLPLSAAPPASAEPATVVSYPAGSTATRFTGRAFDACEAPSIATLTAWQASPYRALGIYFGGLNRGCPQQRNLTTGWVSTVSTMGWRLIPIYMGHQAPCTFRRNAVEFTASTAVALGTADGRDAVTRAKAVGLLPGSALYADVEHYAAADTTCRLAVRRFVSAWTKELHRQGYLAGVYAHLYSGARHLSDSYTSTSYARPDALWIARWDGSSALTGWRDIPNTRWASGQRAKQYQGGHDETYGGVTINIDRDYFDAPVATVAHRYQVTGTAGLTAYSQPTTAATVRATYALGAPLSLVCQTPGQSVGGTAVWDQLSNGTYVSDRDVSTPSSTTYSPPLPRCGYPYQVTTTTLNERTGPGVGYSVAGTLYAGGLAWVSCQRRGTTVSTTAVWDRLTDGRYVSDHYVATPSSTSYSAPIPRC